MKRRELPDSREKKPRPVSEKKLTVQNVAPPIQWVSYSIPSAIPSFKYSLRFLLNSEERHPEIPSETYNNWQEKVKKTWPQKLLYDKETFKVIDNPKQEKYKDRKNSIVPETLKVFLCQKNIDQYTYLNSCLVDEHARIKTGGYGGMCYVLTRGVKLQVYKSAPSRNQRLAIAIDGEVYFVPSIQPYTFEPWYPDEIRGWHKGNFYVEIEYDTPDGWFGKQRVEVFRGDVAKSMADKQRQEKIKENPDQSSGVDVPVFASIFQSPPSDQNSDQNLEIKNETLTNNPHIS